MDAFHDKCRHSTRNLVSALAVALCVGLGSAMLTRGALVAIGLLLAAVTCVALIFLASKRWDPFHPLFLFPLAFVGYFAIGSVNNFVPEYARGGVRGYVGPEIWLYVFVALLAYIAGCVVGLSTSSARRRANTERVLAS